MIVRFVILLAFALLLPVSLTAQNIYASLTGTVTDTSGAVIRDAAVTVTNPDTGLRRSTTTDDRGNYLVIQLPAGSNYQILVENQGFQTQTKSGLVLQVDQRVRLDFIMMVGMIADKAVVEAETPLVQSETSAVGQVITNKQIVELPLNGRDFVQLATLTPGVTPSSGGTNITSSYSTAGSRTNTNNFVLDGIDNNDQAIQAYTARASVDIIQEFKLQTNAYSAENGRWAGGQLNVTTKSGTNKFHGSVFEFLRNSALDARNFFTPAGEKPQFKRNQFGAALGGPIKQDKVFFFVGYEGTRLRSQSTQLASVPVLTFDAQGNYLSPNAIKDPSTGLPFADNIIPSDRIDPIGSGIAALYPVPNRSDPARNFVSTASDPDDVDQFSIRMDYRITSMDTLFARYSYDNQRSLTAYEPPFVVFPGYGRDRSQKAQNGVISYTRILGGSMINEFRVGFNRMDAAYKGLSKYESPADIGITGLDPKAYDGAYPGIPAFNIIGFDTVGNFFLFPQNRWDTTLQVVDHFSLNRGQHALKFGADINRFNVNEYVNPFVRGSFTFTGQYTGSGVADLLLGIPALTMRRLLPNSDRTYRIHTTASFFAQDDWRLLPQLTLNLGIRYEVDKPLTYKRGTMAAFNPQSKVIEMIEQDPAFDPRNQDLPFELPVPLVEINSNTLCRRDNNNLAPRIGLAYRPFNDNKTVIRAGYGVFYNVDGNCGDSALLWRFHQTFIGSFMTPNLSLEDPFPSELGTSAFAPSANIPDARTTAHLQQWNLNVQREVIRGLAVEVGYLGSKGTHLTLSRNINQATLGPGSVDSRRPFSSVGLLNNINLATYDGNSSYHALTAKAEGRLQNALTLLAAYTFAKSMDYDGTPQNAYDLESNRGPSSFVPSQRFTLSAIYTLPYGKTHKLGGNWAEILQAILGGWEVSGILTLQTGFALTPVVSNVDRSLTGGRADRPNLVGNPTLSHRTPEMWFNTAAFELNPLGTFGNAGKGLVIGPGVKTLDFSLMKTFRIREANSLQFRAEMFNLSNTPNFNNPSVDITSVRFGQITSAKTARQIQFGLRYAF